MSHEPQAAPNNTHPTGLYFIFWGEFAERCSYYGMRAILGMYMNVAMGVASMAASVAMPVTYLVVARSRGRRNTAKAMTPSTAPCHTKWTRAQASAWIEAWSMTGVII